MFISQKLKQLSAFFCKKKKKTKKQKKHHCACNISTSVSIEFAAFLQTEWMWKIGF